MFSLLTLASDIFSWTSRRGNLHEVTAEQVGSYSKEALDSKLATANVTAVNFGLTRFGNLLWTPLNFSGSFEGSTRNEAEWYCAMLADDGGVPTMLMNATNGIRESVYYSFFTLDGNSKIVDHNPNSLEYRPPFLASGEWISALCQCSARTAIWGKLAGNATYKNWIAITGGTLNPAGHAGAYFNAPSGVDENAVSIATKLYAFLFQPNLSNATIKVYRCPIVDIQTNQAITWTAIATIYTRGINGDYTDETIRFGNVIFGSADQQPIFQVDGSSFTLPVFSRPQLWGDVNPTTNLISFRLVLCGQHPWGSGYTADALGVAFSFNPDTLTAEVIPEIRGITKIQSAPTQPGGYTLTGPNAYWGERVGLSNNFHPHDTACMGDNQIGLVVRFDNQDAGTISAFTVSEATTPWDFWDYSKHPVRLTGWVRLIRRYPGPFGDSARCTHWLSTNRVAVTTYSNGSSWDVSKRTLAVSTLDPDKMIDFNTARLGNMVGFQPSARDDWDYKFRMGHCEYHTDQTDGSSSLTVGMGRLWEGKLSEFTTVDSDLNYSGNVSVTQSVWNTLKEAVKSHSGTDPIPWSNISDARMELQIFNDAKIPCIGFLCGFDPSTKNYYVTAFAFTPNVRSGVIGSITLNNIITTQASGQSTGIGNRGREYWVPTCVYRNVSEGYTTVSIVQYYFNVATGNSPNLSLVLMLLPDANDYRTDWLKASWSNAWYFGLRHIGVVPGKGLGLYNMSANRTLCGTGMVWQAFGKTKANVEAYSVAASPNIMVMSQQSPTGWFAYIGENIPLLMNGKYATLNTETIDLTKIKADPANTNFYVYVEDNGESGFTYATYTEPQPETLSRCYVGMVVTDATTITQQFMVRVLRIGLHRLSADQVGSAVPVVGGMPTNVAALHWNKTV